jgi:deoxyribodipyrimidine photo-lyase
MIPSSRIRVLNDRPIAPQGAYVLYWMIAARRARSSFGLDRALEHARALGRPLLVFEPLRVAHRWASARFHQFLIDGMRDNQRAFDVPGVRYLPHVETAPGQGSGLLDVLAAAAAVVVTDDFPCFFLPRVVTTAAGRLPVRLEAVDGNGLLPMRAADRAFPTAYGFRRHVQRTLHEHTTEAPHPDPLRTAPAQTRPVVPPAAARWPDALAWLDGGATIASLPIDHTVGPTGLRGGAVAARVRLQAFADADLPRYAVARNDPGAEAASQLSPYLHFGHLSAHEVFDAVMQREGWLGELPTGGRGAREGWWGVSPAAESFLDQLVTWRELGFNMCAHRSDYAEYSSLPEWAQATLARHATDERDALYSLAQFDAAVTADPLWNAAQRQLRREGRIHNYLRMLWARRFSSGRPRPRARSPRWSS